MTSNNEVVGHRLTKKGLLEDVRQQGGKENQLRIGSHRLALPKSSRVLEEWLDEDYDADDAVTHRILGDLCEEDSDEENPDHEAESGRWSSFSWSSLYDRTGTDSSLSWAEDELEKEATQTVKSIFTEIDSVLYSENDGETTELTKEILEECQLWKSRFPHLRIVGKSVNPVPDLFSSPRSQYNHVVAKSQSILTVPNEDDGESEYVFASDGQPEEEDGIFGSPEDLAANPKFQKDPKAYLEEKLISALFKKVWTTIVAKNIQETLTETRSRLSVDQPDFGRVVNKRQSPPLSDLNPVSLPNLSRPVSNRIGAFKQSVFSTEAPSVFLLVRPFLT